MSVQKLTILLVTLCLVAVAVTVVVTQLPIGKSSEEDSSPEWDSDAKAAVYAYLTNREFVLMRGNSVVARVAQLFDEADPTSRKVVWTHSGGYVAFFSDAGIRVDDPAPKELVFVNLRAGTSGRIHCGSCQDFIAIDEDSILLQMYDRQQGSTLSQVNLNSPDQLVQSKIAPSRIEGYTRFFLASTRDYLVTGQTVQVGSSGFRQAIELVKADGSSVMYSDLLDSKTVAIRATDVGNALIAIVSKVTRSHCASRLEISVRDTKGGAIKTDISAAEPPLDASGGIQLNDLWWSPNRQLYATIASMTCDETKPSVAEQQVLEHPSALWKLDGRKWVRDDPEPATIVRQLGQSTRIVLAIPDCIGPVSQPDRSVHCNTGTLFLDQGGKKTPIVEHVLSISTPPA